MWKVILLTLVAFVFFLYITWETIYQNSIQTSIIFYVILFAICCVFISVLLWPKSDQHESITIIYWVSVILLCFAMYYIGGYARFDNALRRIDKYKSCLDTGISLKAELWAAVNELHVSLIPFVAKNNITLLNWYLEWIKRLSAPIPLFYKPDDKSWQYYFSWTKEFAQRILPLISKKDYDVVRVFRQNYLDKLQKEYEINECSLKARTDDFDVYQTVTDYEKFYYVAKETVFYRNTKDIPKKSIYYKCDRTYSTVRSDCIWAALYGAEEKAYQTACINSQEKAKNMNCSDYLNVSEKLFSDEYARLTTDK